MAGGNTTRNIEDKGIRRHAARIVQYCIQPGHNRLVEKGLHPNFHLKGNLGTAKNYRSKTLTSIAVKSIMLCYATTQNRKLRKKIRRAKMAFRKIDRRHHNFWLSVKFKKVFVQKTSRWKYYLSSSPGPLTPYMKRRLSKYFSPTTSPKKPS